MATNPFLGICGPDRYNPNFLKQDWDGPAAEWDVNGDTPIDTMLSMMTVGPRLTDHHCHWTGNYRSRAGGEITGIYTDVGLATPYAGGGVIGTTLYIKMAEALSLEFRKKHWVILRDVDNPKADVPARVEDRNSNGADSYLAVKLMRADAQDANSNLSDWSDPGEEFIVIRGSDSSPVMATMPQAVSYDPDEFDNNAHKVITSVQISAEELKTGYRDNPKYLAYRMRLLSQQHREGLDRAYTESMRSSGTDENGYPVWTMDGVRWLIDRYAPHNHVDYRWDPDFAGKTWDQGGWDFLKERIAMQAGSYGNSNKVLLCGNRAHAAITRLAEHDGMVNIRPGAREWGFQIKELIVGNVTGLLKEVPWWNREPSMGGQVAVLDVPFLTKRPWFDTEFIGPETLEASTSGVKTPRAWVHGVEAMYLTSFSLQLENPFAHAWLMGVGEDNLLP